jgi:hypothetical protein
MRGWTKTENEIWVAKTRNKHRLQKKGTKVKAHKTEGNKDREKQRPESSSKFP